MTTILPQQHPEVFMNREPIIKATVVEVRGTCNALHKTGDVLRLDCYRTGGLCGFFYHSVFPSLQTYEYGGAMPWWKGNDVFLACPDPINQVTIKLERAE
jgi:uncharacterized repeat protein (TIGR04076 family)